MPFVDRVLVTTPREVIVERLRTRTSDPYGRTDDELADRVLMSCGDRAA